MRSRSAFAILLLAVTTVSPAVRTNGTDTRLLAQPAVSATHVAFIYAGDLWSADLDGTEVRRLTTSEGPVSNPAFSPDGKTIAFSAQVQRQHRRLRGPGRGRRADAADVASGADIVQGFTPDGEAGALHVAARASSPAATRSSSPCRKAGGVETPLPIPNAARAAYSPDGRRIAYNPLGAGVPAVEALSRRASVRRSASSTCRANARREDPAAGDARQRRRSDVGRATRSTSARTATASSTCMRTTRKRRQVRQITRHADFPVLNASAGGGQIVYEQAGYLHLLDPATGKSQTADDRRAVGSARDARRFVSGAKWIRDRVALAVRRARRLRVPRRDRHGAGREGRRPQPDADERHPRALAGLVARRHAIA